jgi:hypothetical protein
VALLDRDGRPVGEDGEMLSLDEWPAETTLFAAYDVVYDLVRGGRGEALCWNGEEIRWRHRRFEDGWRRRRSDANVIKLPFSGLKPSVQMAGFRAWRDWLASYGAAPTGTSGSSAWSLLRARLTAPLVTNAGERPPLRFTVGGRQELGPRGRGLFLGRLAHLDLPAAYASTLAGLRYGGVWLHTSDSEALKRYEGTDNPVFVRARVRVPDGVYGGLVRRPGRRPRSTLESVLLGNDYPTGRVLQGLWTWEELEAAERHGTRVLKILEGWVHRSGRYPFQRWWEAIQAGREMPGLAGQLAKVTGNALWGRFCLDVASGGKRTIRSRNGEIVSRPLPARGQQWPAHDLAETVSGRVRARLYDLIMEVGDGLVCAHTDGAWIMNGGDASGKVQTSDREAAGWRLKEQARRLELLNPQKLRYWPRPPRRWEPAVVYAGVPAERAGVIFEREWGEAGFA